MNYREKIRKAIECPQFGNERYGEWGALSLEQRTLIRRLLNELDNADNCVKKLLEENEELKENYQEELDENCKLSELWCDCRARIRELKKQLEDMTLCRDIASGHRQEVQDRETILLNQQQEFIKYLKDEIKELEYSRYVSFNKFGEDKLMFYREILQKYKLIIGETNDTK